jgi:sec-independent protein translocase protein TatB
MFDIGWGELLLIGVVALIVIGPKELPGTLRTLGQWMGKLRRMASEFQGQFQEAMREAELADLKKQVDDMTSQAQSYANFDPVSEVRKEFESTQQQIESAITDKPQPDAPGTPAVSEPGPISESGALSGPAAAETTPAVAPGTEAQVARLPEPEAAGTDAAKHDGKPA